MWFFIFLPIMITIHELAHLVTAKRCGCPVEVFSIGFGKPLIKRKWKGTVYQIAAIPLGGFCKLKGENKESFVKGSFNTLPYRKKVYITLAGIIANVITGLIALIIGFRFYIFLPMYFGVISITLGLSNLLPIAPCLDGGYLLYMPLFIKIWGKKKGLKYFYKSVSVSFHILLWLNIACMPYLIYLWMKGLLI